MTRETRYNLIFIIVLVILLTPGAVILFRKKLEPTARPMYLPDPVPHGIAYMSAQELPPRMERVEPQHTSAWVKSIARQHVDASATLCPVGTDRLPLMSDGKTFQVIGYQTANDALRIWILFWLGETNVASLHWSLEGSPANKGKVDQILPVNPPNLVREELGENGVLKPPKGLIMQSILFPSAGAQPWQVRVTGSDDFADRVNIVTSFTSPAAIRN